MINERGQFVKGSTPHNKREFISCRVAGCDRKDHKGLGYCGKHYKVRQSRMRLGQPFDDVSLENRIPRTEEHIKNNLAYIKKPGFVSKLKGRTYEDIYGALAQEKKTNISKRLKGVLTGRVSPMRGRKTGKPAWNRGKRHMALEKNHFWRGGISKEKYGCEFTNILKNTVRDRDGRVCIECGVSEVELGYLLSVHHLDCNKKNNQIDNLVSLCKKCHAKVHWSASDWRNYFSNTIKENSYVRA